MNPPPSNVTAEECLAATGLDSMLILNNNGIPLVVRHYREDSLLSNDEVLVSSFFSAMSTFANQLLLSYISDIGLVNQRLFFKYQGDVIYVLVFDEGKLVGRDYQSIRQFVEQIMWHLVGNFYPFYDQARRTLRPMELSRAIHEFHPTIDALMVSGTQEYLRTSVVEGEPLLLTDLTFEQYGLEHLYILRGEEVLCEFELEGATPNVFTGDILNSFFAAITAFASNAFMTSLSDVGLFSNRLYVHTEAGFTFMLVVNELVYIGLSITDERALVEKILRRITRKFLDLPHHDQELITKEMLLFLRQWLIIP